MTVVPIYNMVVAPNARTFMQTDLYKRLTGKDPEENEQVVLLIARKQALLSEMRQIDFYPIGVSGRIAEINQNGYLVFKTGDRVNVENLSIIGGERIELEAIPKPDIEDLDAEDEKSRLEVLKSKLVESVKDFRWGVIARNYFTQMKTIGEVTSLLSIWMTNSPDEKYAVLEQNSCEKRTAMMEKMVYEYLEITKITNEAETEQKKDYEKLYRQEAIKKQMQYLQKELDEMDPENVSDIRRLELAVEESGMNEEAKKEAGKVLSRLKQEGQHSQEAGMLYDYLDFMAQLPWKKEKAKAIDLDEAEKVLDEDHFGLKKVKQRIVQQVAVMNLQHKQSGSILLFVGAPGTGKTSIGKSIAKALGREYVRVSLGGVRDEADIRGHRRTYIGAMPGRIMDGIHKAGVSNPVMVLDEVDKLSMSYNGDPASALLEVLDPEQNNTFTDHYANVPYDLSDVFFICTANSLDTIPEPLLNRMEVIQFEGYTATDKFQIAKRHLLPRAYAAMGIDEERLMLPDETLRAIISDYTMEAGVRGLKKRIDTLCRAAAVQIVKGEGEQLTIAPDELRDYLDMRPVTHDHILAKKKPGIVTGLAWTRVGGEILFIETLMTAGSGKVIITGQLGDVMKESVQIAVSLVKAMFPEQAEKFEKNDLHVHVPAGAVPKDGPSAGITLTTAIASLVCQKAVSPEFAMTGEVSLRGVVTPIGGLPEKLMAAQRAGIQKVFIPKDNVDDLKDVADEVKARLTVIPVGTVQEVFEKTGVIGEMQDRKSVV